MWLVRWLLFLDLSLFDVRLVITLKEVDHHPAISHEVNALSLDQPVLLLRNIVIEERRGWPTHVKRNVHWVDLIEWVKQARFTNSSAEVLNEQWQNLRVPAAAQPLERAFSGWLDSASELNQAALHEKTIE